VDYSASPPNKFLIVIVGPTAVGKTSLAIDLARIFDAEIISADSRQFFRELRIGSSAPLIYQLKMVPHHFIGHLNVTDNYNVYRFESDVLELLEILYMKMSHVIMTGGSGLYIDAVCHGIDELPDPDPLVRQNLLERYAKEGIAALQNELAESDPAYYEAVDKNNPKRLIRALEVCIITGKRYSDLRLNKPKIRNFEVIKIGLDLPREELFNRINNRVDNMINMGLVGEASSLIPFRHLNALNTVGYKEIFKYLDGELSLDRAIEKIKTNSRHYAKRQLTWFKRDVDTRWFKPDQLSEIIDYIKEKST
jgi:tRNA dimethylallyltransferase